jgi:hypothetical protein
MYPLYKIVIDDSETTGMEAISFVNMPAIESDFLKLNKNKKEPKLIVLEKEGEYKQVLAGLALVPNKPMYRNNDGFEYYVYFEAQEIEKIRDKFHKSKLTDVVNLQHNSKDVVDAYLIESYIVNSEERLNEVKSQGIDDVVMGSWYVQYKIEDKEVFKKALDGELNGFSIEIRGNLIPDNNINFNKNNKNNSIMSKFNDLINKFKSVLNEFELETAKIADTERSVTYGEVGEPVYEIKVDEAGVETSEPIGEGEYILDNGKTIVVDENSSLVEVKEATEEVDPINDEELEEEVAETEETVVDEETEDVIVALLPKDDNGKIIDGYYDISVEVVDGKISSGSIYSSSYKELEFKNQKLQKELNKFKAEVEKLSKEPIANPVNVFSKVKDKSLSKAELNKMSNLEFQLYKLGLKK